MVDKLTVDTKKVVDERTELVNSPTPNKAKDSGQKASIKLEKTGESVKKSIHEFKSFGGGEIEMLACRIDPEDNMVAAGGSDGIIHVYSIGSTDKPLHTLNGAHTIGTPITALRWRPHTGLSKTKHVLASSCADGNVSFWHVSSGKLLYRIREEDNQVLALDYNKDGSQFATAGKDRTIRIYDESTKSKITEMTGGIWQYPGHSNRIFSVKFSPLDPNMLVSAGWDNTLYFWDIRDSKSFGSIYGPSVSGDSLDIKGKMILTGSWRSKEQLELWDFQSRKKISDIHWDKGYSPERAMVYSCQFSKCNGESIVAGCSNLNEVRIFDRNNNNQSFGKISDLHKGVYSVDYGNNSDIFSFCGGDGHVHVVQITKTKVDEEK